MAGRRGAPFIIPSLRRPSGPHTPGAHHLPSGGDAGTTTAIEPDCCHASDYHTCPESSYRYPMPRAFGTGSGITPIHPITSIIVPPSIDHGATERTGPDGLWPSPAAASPVRFAGTGIYRPGHIRFRPGASCSILTSIDDHQSSFIIERAGTVRETRTGAAERVPFSPRHLFATGALRSASAGSVSHGVRARSGERAIP